MDKKILIVDDDASVMKMMYYTVKNLGCEILKAENGREALDIADKENPDLILLDYRMPIVDGVEVSQRIKTSEALKHIKIILITASVDEIEDKFEESLADEYMLKPFDPKTLLDKVKNIL